ncbi:hypothetical protein SBA1_1930002 [Candidatus Sulfotelmatobacter kueseliae]|uniref:Uncharacterized protein n=1 Tax=Candidatus Sulfotelmatobacter kueseliae TaxID=2042962 RepID=A0A2U3KF82_9BACT|nr:hypothetical protein SBA1_1930002 [Candidatus Sulfotelmatobacter kueseliae]
MAMRTNHNLSQKRAPFYIAYNSRFIASLTLSLQNVIRITDIARL